LLRVRLGIDPSLDPACASLDASTSRGARNWKYVARLPGSCAGIDASTSRGAGLGAWLCGDAGDAAGTRIGAEPGYHHEHRNQHRAHVWT